MRIIKGYIDFLNENLNSKISLHKDENWFIDAVKREAEDEANGVKRKIFLYPSSTAQSMGAPEVPIRDGEGSEELEEGVENEAKNVAIDSDDPLKHLDFPIKSGGKLKVKNVGIDGLLKAIQKSVKYHGTSTEELPLLIWGAPGIGKTQIVNTVARGIDANFIDCPLAQLTIEDFAMPTISSEADGNTLAQRAIRVPLSDLPLYHISEGAEGNRKANGPGGKGGILFLDELSRAKEAVRNVALKLVNERKLGNDWILGDKWIVVAAANRREDDETNDYEFGAALANRFRNINFSPRFKDYEEHFTSRKVPETGEPLFDPLMLQFLQWPTGQKWLHQYKRGDVAFPSPRTWEAAAKSWYNEVRDANEEGRTASLSDLQDALSQNIGPEAAEEFIDFYKTAQKIDLRALENVWTDPAKAPLPKKNSQGDYEMDMAFIIAINIAYLRRGRELTKPEFDNLVTYITTNIDNPTTAQQILQAVIDTRPDWHTWIKSKDGLAVVRNGLIKFIMKYPGYENEIKSVTGVDVKKDNA